MRASTYTFLLQILVGCSLTMATLLPLIDDDRDLYRELLPGETRPDKEELIKNDSSKDEKDTMSEGLKDS